MIAVMCVVWQKQICLLYTSVDFDDRSWTIVSTPHTVELMPAEASGCRNYQGPAWYRKHFVLPAETKGKQVLIHFEAAMGKQVLYLNGKRIQEHIGGYLPFTLDLTANGVQAGDSCLLAVFIDNSNDKSFPPGKPQYTLDFAYPVSYTHLLLIYADLPRSLNGWTVLRLDASYSDSNDICRHIIVFILRSKKFLNNIFERKINTIILE